MVDNKAREFYQNPLYIRDAAEYAIAEKEQRKDTLKAYLPLPEELVLELGCGCGILQDVHSGYLGLDISLPALKEVFRGIRAITDNLPIKDQKVMLAFSFNTLEHLDRVETTLREIDRVLKPEGVALFYDAWLADIPYLNMGEILWRKIVSVLWRVEAELSLFLGRPTVLRFWLLNPDYSSFALDGADRDATISIDARQVQLWFASRGYRILDEAGPFKRCFGGMPRFVAVKKGVLK
jgi:SAM-dependent methyltransferase